MQVERIDNVWNHWMNGRMRNHSSGKKVRRGDVGEWRTGE